MRSKDARRVLSLVILTFGTPLLASTWYVDHVNGNDSNNCVASSTPCKTIGHAISLATAGDSIRIAPATYKENLTLSFDLSLIGSDASTTIIDGRNLHPVITINGSGDLPTRVLLSHLTIQRG